MINTLRPRQHGRHFADDTFERIFLNQNVRISIKISLKFVPKGPINNIPSLVQIMAWRRPGDKPLSEPMMVSLRTDICVTRPQRVKQQSDIHTTPDFTSSHDGIVSWRFGTSSLSLSLSLMNVQHITTFYLVGSGENFQKLNELSISFTNAFQSA